MTVRVRDAIPSSRPRRKPGWGRWRVERPRSWVTPTSCGPPGCSPHMPGNTDRPPGIRAWASWPKGTVCKILAEQEVKPHKVRYYLEQRDAEFEPQMAEILCVYRQVAILRAEGERTGGQDGGSLALVSYDVATSFVALSASKSPSSKPPT